MVGYKKGASSFVIDSSSKVQSEEHGYIFGTTCWRSANIVVWNWGQGFLQTKWSKSCNSAKHTHVDNAWLAWLWRMLRYLCLTCKPFLFFMPLDFRSNLVVFVFKLLKGYLYQEYNACPPCGPWLDVRYSKPLRKTIYQGHAIYLPKGHALWDGNLGRPPIKQLKESDWKQKWKENGNSSYPGMKRLSIFHNLPYWWDLLINHLLDPMHIFKNVGKNIWKNIIGKKESKAQRDDLHNEGCMQPLWERTNKKGKQVLSRAPWVLSRVEALQVKRTISEFQTPTGCMHCLKGEFTKDDDLSGLKSHDWQKLLHFVLLVAIKDCLTEDIRETIYKISSLVRWISSKEIRKDTLEEACLNSIEVACMVEKFFPTNMLTSRCIYWFILWIRLHLLGQFILDGCSFWRDSWRH